MQYTLELKTIKLHKTGNRFFSYYTSEEEELESGLGRIHIILETTSKDRALIEFSSELVAVIKDTFFHSPSSNIEASLELACQKANAFFLNSALDHHKCYSKLSCIAFATHENSISCSSITNGRLLLLRKQRINHVIEPTFSKTKKESGKPKLFTNITSGLLEPGDTVIASTRNLNDYFNDEKLKHILRQLKLSDAAKAIEDDLQKIPSTFGFEVALALLKKQTPAQYQGNPSLSHASEQQTALESMSQMTQRETTTSKLLIEPPVTSLKKLFNNAIARMKSSARRSKPAITAPADSSTAQSPRSAPQKPSIVPPSIAPEAFRTKIHTISAVLFVKNRFLTLGTVLLIIFILTTLSQTRLIAFKSKDSEVLSAIREEMNQAELALIYKNRVGALAELNQAREQIRLLKNPDSTEAKNLRAALETVSRSVYVITDQTPEQIVDLSSYDKSNTVKDIFTSKGTLYSFTQHPFQLLEIKQSEKKAQPIPIEIPLKPERIVGDANDVLISDGTTLASLDIAKKTLGISTPAASLVFTPYAGRAYVVINNTIMRLDRNETARSWKSTPWLSDGTSIQNALSIAIDGDIYIGIRGNILKFTKGKQQAFTLPDLGYSPTPSAIVTSVGSDRLFILDTEQKRIIIITKSGELIKQVSLETFEPTISPSLVVDEIKKSIFFRAGNGIWKVTY